MFSNGWVTLEKQITCSFADGIQGAREVHALRAQEQFQRHEERCVGQKVERKEEPPLANPEKGQWIAPDNGQTTEENQFLDCRHRARTILPEFRGSVVCPTPKGCSIFGIVGAMGAHHSNLEEPEEPHDDGDPSNQRPGPECEYASSSNDKPGKTDQEKVGQLFWMEMAVNHGCYWAVSAVGSYTSGYWFR